MILLGELYELRAKLFLADELVGRISLDKLKNSSQAFARKWEHRFALGGSVYTAFRTARRMEREHGRIAAGEGAEEDGGSDQKTEEGSDRSDSKDHKSKEKKAAGQEVEMEEKKSGDTDTNGTSAPRANAYDSYSSAAGKKEDAGRAAGSGPSAGDTSSKSGSGPPQAASSSASANANASSSSAPGQASTGDAQGQAGGGGANWQGQREQANPGIPPEMGDETIPAFLQVAWRATVLDLDGTVKNSCRYLFKDTSVPWQVRLRRAQALLILSKTFLEHAKTLDDTDLKQSSISKNLIETSMLGAVHRGDKYEK